MIGTRTEIGAQKRIYGAATRSDAFLMLFSSLMRMIVIQLLTRINLTRILYHLRHDIESTVEAKCNSHTG